MNLDGLLYVLAVEYLFCRIQTVDMPMRQKLSLMTCCRTISSKICLPPKQRVSSVSVCADCVCKLVCFV